MVYYNPHVVWPPGNPKQPGLFSLLNWSIPLGSNAKKNLIQAFVNCSDHRGFVSRHGSCSLDCKMAMLRTRTWLLHAPCCSKNWTSISVVKQELFAVFAVAFVAVQPLVRTHACDWLVGPNQLNQNFHKASQGHTSKDKPLPALWYGNAVDVRNPAPPGMYRTLQIVWYSPFQLVQDFFHQQQDSNLTALFFGLLPSRSSLSALTLKLRHKLPWELLPKGFFVKKPHLVDPDPLGNLKGWPAKKMNHNMPQIDDLIPLWRA